MLYIYFLHKCVKFLKKIKNRKIKYKNRNKWYQVGKNNKETTSNQVAGYEIERKIDRKVYLRYDNSTIGYHWGGGRGSGGITSV